MPRPRNRKKPYSVFTSFSKLALCATASVAVLSPSVFVVPAARADTTALYEVTVKGGLAPGKYATVSESATATATVFYKNNKSRTESENSVVLYDNGTKTTTTLDPRTKTYTTVTDAEVAAANNAATNPLAGQIKFSIKTFVRPGNQTRTIAGRETKNTKFTAILKMALTTADAPAGMAHMLPTITLSGEEWMTEGLVDEPQKQGMAALATWLFTSMAQLNPLVGTNLKAFADKVAAIKGFPLASTLQTTVAFPEGAAAMMGASIPSKPMVVTMQAKSVSEEPLNDTLFIIPDGYKKMDNPAPVSPQAPPAVL